MAGPVEVTSKKVKPVTTYRASRITLYGVPFRVAECTVGTGGQSVGLACGTIPSSSGWIAALIYGYAYQGHVYSLSEPTVMLVQGAGNPADDAGYGSDYLKWEADKLDRTAQLLVSNDTFEELILKKSMGETRQPISYNAAMMVSHRGGKLMD